MLQSIRAFAQTTTYLGVVMIVAIWGGIYIITNDAHDRAYEDGLRQGSNLTRLFEEYIWRVIREADSQLLVLRKLYEQDPVNFDFARWIDNEKLPGDLTVHFSITGPDGVIRLSTLGPIQSRVDIGHMESFSIHTLSTSDDLYISPPSTGQMSGKTSIQLTRRLVRPDGSFGGVIGGFLNVLQLEDFYNSIDVGPAGVIALVGFDGIIRARSGRNATASSFIGQSVADTKVFGLFRQSPTGAYWNAATVVQRI
jgi:two-component system, sensor histidine kinase